VCTGLVCVCVYACVCVCEICVCVLVYQYSGVHMCALFVEINK